MSERQAWLKIAKVWESQATMGDSMGINGFFVDIGNGPSYGICCCIYDLCILGVITESVAKKMIEKIPKRRVKGFVWRRDEKGSALRAHFCRKQANLLKRKTA